MVAANTGTKIVEDKINVIQTLNTDKFVIQENGFFEVFVNNEAQTPVFFDNLVVSHTPSQILEVNTYYPFGMLMQGSDMTFQSAIRDDWNGYKYNAKELQTELELGWLDYGARMLDPVLGRWFVPDPMAEMYYGTSPYMYCLGNPIRYIDPYGLWTQTANGWTTDDPNDISRFMNMMQYENHDNQTASIVQINTFVHEEFMGTGGRLSNGSVLLSEVTATKNDQGKWEIPEYQMAKMHQEVDYWGSLHQNEDGVRWYYNVGIQIAMHSTGPVLVGLTGPVIHKDTRFAKWIWSASRSQWDSKWTSVASLYLRKKLPSTTARKSWLPKAGSLGGQWGRALGNTTNPLGIVLSIYDIVNESMKLGQIYGPSKWYGDNDDKWFE